MEEYICPHCGMTILDEDALLCHHCGESLGRASQGALGKMRYTNPKTMWIVVTLLVLLAFILLYVY